MLITQYICTGVRDEPGLGCPSCEDGVLPSENSEDAHPCFLSPHKPNQSPQAANTRDSEASIMEIFMCGTVCGYGRVMQAQEQGGLAEPGMETNHPSAWRVWSP